MKMAYQQLNVLYEVVKKAMLISDSPRAGNLRTLQLEKIVEKVVLHVRSILLLIDGNRGCFEELDVALIASATRNIMDSVNLYFHIAERGLSEDQKQLRFLTLYINGQRNNQSIAYMLGFSNDCERIASKSLVSIEFQKKSKHCRRLWHSRLMNRHRCYPAAKRLSVCNLPEY